MPVSGGLYDEGVGVTFGGLPVAESRPTSAANGVAKCTGCPVAAVTPPKSEPSHDLFSAQDRDLLRRCLANAPDAWDTFVDRYAGLIAFVVTRTAGQRGQALSSSDRDDLVADVLVELVRNDAAVLRSFAGRASFPSYLTVIARRVAVRSLGRSARSRQVTSSPTVDDAAARHSHAAEVADREEIETLLQRLDPAAARLVRLHHLEGRSYGEISRITGMPLGSVGPALSQARSTMRGIPAG